MMVRCLGFVRLSATLVLRFAQQQGTSVIGRLKDVFVTARLPDENRRGPRRNPYGVRLPRWKAITQSDELWFPDALAPTLDHDRVITERMPTPGTDRLRRLSHDGADGSAASAAVFGK